MLATSLLLDGTPAVQYTRFAVNLTHEAIRELRSMINDRLSCLNRLTVNFKGI